MPLSTHALPLPTPYDAAEDPPSSIDPLGTLAYSERLAEELLPGMTSRMYHARFLTLAAVAALVSERVVARMAGREDVRLEARLAFERLYVAAIMRADTQNPEEWRRARQRLPGSDLAREALRAGQPLTRNNFLKGQAVNGPVGVIATLARNLDIMDDEGSLGGNGSAVVLAWAEDEGLRKVLSEEDVRDHEGSAWIADVVKTVAASLKGEWPGGSHRIWDRLAQRLRPDRMGLMEKAELARLLRRDDRRARVFGVLRENVNSYKASSTDRGEMEREMLTKVVKVALGNDPLDRTLATTISAIDVYETTSGLFQQAFEALIWGLQNRGGQAAPTAIVRDARIARSLGATCSNLRRRLPALDTALGRLREDPCLGAVALTEPMSRMRDECEAARESPAALMETVMVRHERVQREKRKATWIDREAKWILKPGFGIGGDAPPKHEGKYLHPFRIANAYFLMDRVGNIAARVRNDGA